jgi:CRP-like cAMP-binding protein
MREGDNPTEIFRVQSGWCARLKILADGSRQVLSFIVPGDVLSLELRQGEPIRFSVVAMTEVTICAFSRRAISLLAQSNVEMTAATIDWWARKVADLEQSVTSLGRMPAAGRIAGLILHFHRRLKDRGLADGLEFALPLRHEDLADALGITPPHLSRTLASMRDDGLLELGQGKASIKNYEAMTALCN